MAHHRLLATATALVLATAIFAQGVPPPPPPPPPPTKMKADSVYKVVEHMPRFPGCEDVAGGDAEKKKCADKKMLEFIYKNLRYPEEGKEDCVEGTVVVSFIVERDGTVTNAEVVRSIHPAFDKEAVRVVMLMNKHGIKWTPGRSRSRSPRVQFNLPVRFKLE